MKIKVRKGFTLIELLVVITIIGILATGAVQVFTRQIQNARDATRISDITALRGGIEQVYQALGSYPTKGNTDPGTFGAEMGIYIQRLPTDPKTTEASNDSIFDYLYNVSQDDNGVRNQEFEVSTHFESQGNITSRADDAVDGGNDMYRLEFGINVADASNDTIVILPAGIPNTVNTYECLTPTGTVGDCDDQSDPMIIRG